MPRKTTRTAAAETAESRPPRIEDIRASLARLADEAENRKIDLESDFPDASPVQRESIDRAQTCTARAMELLATAGDLLDPTAARFHEGAQGAKSGRSATSLLVGAGNALAAFLDAFEGIVSEQGIEGLDRFCKDPEGLMVKAGTILEDIASFTGDGKEKK